MKLTIKTLKQISYSVEIADNANVSELKETIGNSHGFDSKSMKLLYNGKVLEDTNKLSDMGIVEGHVIMMMSAKAKPVNVIKEESKAEEPVPTNTKTNQNKSENKVAEKKADAKKLEIVKKDYTNEVNQLKEMGFSEELSKSAIEAAKGNVTQAIEYLYNGIPQSTGNRVTNEQLYGDFFDDEEGEFEEEEPFELNPELLNNLDLNHPDTLKNLASIVKVLIQEDPSQLSNLLMEIEESNPEIIDFIKEHESEFKSIIEKPLTNEDIQVFDSLVPSSHAHEGGEDEPLDEEGIQNLLGNIGNMGNIGAILNQNQGTNALNLPTTTLNLSDSDKEAIERLKTLGFSESEVTVAYMACDKNETLAANFLFDNKYKDDNMNVDCKIIY